MATPVFACGFECGLFNAQGHWGAGGGTIVTTGQAHGVRAGQWTKTDTAQKINNTVATFAGSGIIVCRASVYFSSLPDANAGVIASLTGSTQAGVAFVSSDSTLRTYIGAAGGASGVVVTTGQWYEIDFYVNSTANPWTCDARVNGTAVAQVTNAIAADTATAKSLRVGLLGTTAASGTVIIDNVVVSVTSGDYPLGTRAVFGYVPSSDGTHNIAGADDFERGNTGTDLTNSTTDAYTLIDDVPLPSGAVDEADCWRAVAPPNSTDYPESVFAIIPGGTGSPSGAPDAVEAVCIHHQITTDTGSYEVLLNDNGTTGVVSSATGAAGVTTYRVGRAHFATAPTGGAWTVASGAGNFTNLRVRFRSADALPDQCLDAIMVEAAFRPPAGEIAVNDRKPGRPAPFKPGLVR